MKSISEAMKAYMLTHPFDSGNSDCQTVLDQLYHAYAESHEHDPQEIGDGFKELEEYLCVLPLDNNNAVFNLCCRLCSAYLEKKNMYLRRQDYNHPSFNVYVETVNQVFNKYFD